MKTTFYFDDGFILLKPLQIENIGLFQFLVVLAGKNSDIPSNINARVINAKKILYVIRRGTSTRRRRGSSLNHPHASQAR